MNIRERQKYSLMRAPGITEADADKLIDSGVFTLAHAVRLGAEKLQKLPGIGASKAAALVNKNAKVVKK